MVVGMRRNPPLPLADRLLPDALWERIRPLLPPPPGGGAPRTVPDRACMAAIIFMCRTSTPWALLPVGELGCGSVTSCWNGRGSVWTPPACGRSGGDLCGANPVDRAKPGCKWHLAVDGTGMVLSL